ncbi:aspartyl-phosphate phosphatase Spo0E family protein [Virgibacillus siamensis]|uniref:aspartyl-phosphate phosphatase Spo0E family protein n=1 Tax=Virgibacillus siamensis TaxID=480071 RepID=UPI0009863436|nr:aspartyl-phosphate phosphatase Spo0E family protein [Virgibacillus siamensis]
MCAADKLLNNIELLRKKMTDVALQEGFSSNESVEISQELDKLLNRYNEIKQPMHHKD